MDILSKLNDNQRTAVEYNDGPSIVIAGAGSGKTRVLTYKIAYLIQMGMKPWNILALTFTNKAANEMKERIVALVGDDARFLHMGTFHSIFARILRAEAQFIPVGKGTVSPFTSQFTIYDETDSRSLIKSIVKELDFDDKLYKPAMVHERISLAKNNIQMPDDYAKDNICRERDNQSRTPRIAEVYELYQERMRQSNAMDFDDLLLYTYLLLKGNEVICKKYGDRFRYVLVDEYQDTNSVQKKIVELIVAEHKHICVVGDDAQSIYSFRGANIDNILDFQQFYTDAKLFKLERNYRSTQNIVDAANGLIEHNKRQIPKTAYSKNERGEKLQLKFCVSDREEAIVVCRDIKRLHKEYNFNYSDFAILYRTNAQSRTFEEQLRKDNIPHRIIGGLAFYQRKEIKDAIAYMRLTVNNHDSEALRRVINYPTRGIGNTTVEKVMKCASRNEVSPWEVVTHPVEMGLDVNKGTMKKLIDFANVIYSFSARLVELDAFQLGKAIIEESGIMKDLFSGTEPDDIARQENIQELIDSMAEFVDSEKEENGDEHIYLTDFLQQVALMSDLDSNDGNSDDKVFLMTIHSAKGLEFPVVFVVGLEENIFPAPKCCESMRALEEERRLLYVAITRAGKYCFLTLAKNRYRYGNMETNNPSRFINDLPMELVATHGLGGNADTQTDALPWEMPAQRTGYRGQQYGSHYGRDMQNSRPVASQFRADPKPKITTPSLNIPGRTLRRLQPQNTPATVARPSTPTRSNVQSPSTSSPTDVSVGNTIEHNRFGIGEVISVEGSGANAKATVDFRNAGRKQLLLKFAQFKILG